MTANTTSYPQLAIPLGDPAGIGTEVILKALADSQLTQNCNIALVGSRVVLEHTYQHLQASAPIADPDKFPLVEVELESPLQFKPGVGSASTGAASFAYLNRAITETLAGKFHGIVTAPIAKTLWKEAGQHYPGQTELLAEQAGVKRFGMMFVARSPQTQWTLRTLLATTHIPLCQVSSALSAELMDQKLALLIDSLHRDFGLERPKIAVSGLNPHSGENGQLGTEERDWLIPWLQQARQHYPQICLDGPIPPDTLWVRPGQAWFGTQNRAHDAYLALYHDQGLIPVKLLAFDQAVNTTIGLPFVRTSPDHGTAFDIAGRGIADASSMVAAIRLATELVHQRLSIQQGYNSELG